MATGLTNAEQDRNPGGLSQLNQAVSWSKCPISISGEGWDVSMDDFSLNLGVRSPRETEFNASEAQAI